ncbi:MAG: hypothetical protein M0Z53_03955 [Thermaerobacter sp.]|nr:hypothetical protein [Thermaerobacter sp.]
MADETPHTANTRLATRSEQADLLTIVTLRFGNVSDEVLTAVFATQEASRVGDLMLAAANATGWAEFERQLRAPGLSSPRGNSGLPPVERSAREEL